MIIGAHSVIYSSDADADRKFLRDVLKLTNVDVGHGWLIFGLPPSEVAVHPSEKNDVHEFYLMCDAGLHLSPKCKTSRCLRSSSGSAIWLVHTANPSGRRQARRLSAAACEAKSDAGEMTSNQPIKPTPPLRYNFRMFAMTPCRGLSLSR